jgi:hypothetical protein
VVEDLAMSLGLLTCKALLEKRYLSLTFNVLEGV